MNRVFANGLEGWGSILVRVIPKVVDAVLLNSQYYKVRIKGKMKQSRERSSAIPQHNGLVAIEKRAFGSPLTKVANFTYIYAIFTRVHTHMHICLCSVALFGFSRF